MSAQFASQLRARSTPITLSGAGASALTFRVQAADLWETVRFVAGNETPVEEVKRIAVEQLFPNQPVEDFVLKLRGWEMLDERETLSRAGVMNGATLLLAIRRRRPVR